MRSALLACVALLVGALIGSAAVYLSEHHIAFRRDIYVEGEHFGFRIGMSKEEAIEVAVRNRRIKIPTRPDLVHSSIRPRIPPFSRAYYNSDVPEDRKLILSADEWAIANDIDSWPSKFIDLRFCGDELIYIIEKTRFFEAI